MTGLLWLNLTETAMGGEGALCFAAGGGASLTSVDDVEGAA